MTPTRWQQIDQLLESALELPADQRAAFLESACNGDGTLRREVEQLLAADESVEDFLESAPAEAMAEVLDAKLASSLVGSRVGPYQILRELGRGGMGVVCLAERTDQQYRQQVAIKLLWPGVNQAEIIRRFRRERQILANLHHPNIAQLFDGGTTEDGRPYFVMEHVTGQPITEYCRARQLTIAERLTLFQQFCSAVQYAHQNLVIHRDLKPGNILVTEDGTVKLLDFGIAKLLDAERHGLTAQPTTNALMMTPEYASPEQMRGQPVTTASDVYSLGVVLYELLTGQSPYEFKDRNLPELIRVVCDEEPILPSRRAGSSNLRGDLDGILLTALQKEPQRRYQSVQQFHDDIRRHLEGQPVQAQTITLRYRAGKFVRRNKLLVAATAAVVLALLAGTIVATWQARRATEQARLNRRLLYAAQMNLAGQAWDAANISRAEQLVEANLPQPGEEDLRGFEWHYLRRLVRQNLRLTLPHPHEVRAVAFSPDGSMLATGGGDNIARLWDAATGSLLKELKTHTQRVNAVTFSYDGKTLATGSDDNLIGLWEVTSGKLLRRMVGQDDDVLKLAFSPDGQWLASSTHAPWIDVFKLSTETVFIPLNGHRSTISGLSLSPDGRWIASGSDDSLVKIWNVPVNYLPGITQRCYRSWWPMAPGDGIWRMQSDIDNCYNVQAIPAPSRELTVLKSHRDRILAVAFAPDGKLLASAGADQTIKLWDTTNWREVASLTGHSQMIRAVAFSPDGKTLVSGSEDRFVKLWDVAARRELSTIRGHGGKVYSLAFSPDGQTLATASDDHTVKLWDMTANTQAFTELTGHTDEVDVAAFSPDGKIIATAGDDKTIKLWDAASGQALKTLTGHISWVQSQAFSPDGKRLASADRKGNLIFWDTASGNQLLNLQAFQQDVFSVAFSPNGQHLVVAGLDDLQKTNELRFGIRVLDSISGQLRASIIGHKDRLRSVTYSPDGKLLATAGGDQLIKIWNAETGQELGTLAGHQGEIWKLAFSPDGRTLASGSRDRTIRFWDVATGRELSRLDAHSDSVYSVAFSPDGRRLASASTDRTIKLWDVATRQELLTLRGHQGEVYSVAFSPDGQTLLSASGDRTARLWRAK
ncbi:MAG: protein kinase [Acidobacteriota bacterium]|nr:protein kinase [Acidobacteriota bacterium]